MNQVQPTIRIAGGRLIDPANGIDQVTDLYIALGRIAAIGEAPEGFVADQEIDASGHVVCPGLIDLSVRLREPGQEHKATLFSETAAAAKAGITTLCCQPDTDPLVDTPAVATMIRRRSERIGFARVLPIGALTRGLAGEQLTNMAALQEAGCVALGTASRPIRNALVAYRAMEYAATFGIPVFCHIEDPDLRGNGCAHKGPVATRLGLPGIPEAAETVALSREVALARETECRVHFQTLSSGGAVRLLRHAHREQLRVTAGVAAHQLHLTEMDLDGFDANCHVNPPLRGLTDRDALRGAVADGTITAICSDHQPHEPDAKMAPFPSTAQGISGLETLLPLTLRLVDERVMALTDAIARLTIGPARVLGLPLGQLGVGMEADICIFDPEEHWTLTAGQIGSAGRNTPFLGWELRGRVKQTLLQGRVVHPC